jgi:hypothetical protein
VNIKIISLSLTAVIFLSTFTANLHAKSYGTQHDKVQKLFQSNEEKTAKDAIWTANNIFKVGVINDGSSRSGYAQYVCSVLNDYGFKGKGIWVQVIDIVKLTNNGKWVKLGDSRCK